MIDLLWHVLVRPRFLGAAADLEHGLHGWYPPDTLGWRKRELAANIRSLVLEVDIALMGKGR